MASNQRIDDLIAQQAFEQVERLTTQLKGLQGELVTGVKNAKLLSDTLAGAKGLREINKATSEAAKEIEKLNRLIAQTALVQSKKIAADERAIKLANDRAISEQRLNQEKGKSLIVEERLNREIQKGETSKQREAAAAQKASQAYQILNAAYQEATQLARNAGAQFGENSKQFQNAARSANFLRERLDAIDRPLGNYQRNVGNYRSAFDGLGNSFQQLSRELPAFAVSFQTGILALSNNLPIFFDQIKQTRLEVARLRAEGQQTPGVFARLVQSLTSPIGLLTLGVTLFTLYSKEIGEFTKSLFKGTDALNAFTERQNVLSEALKSNDFKEANKDVLELATNFQLAKKGVVDKEDVLKQYNSTLGDTLGKTNDFNEAEKLLAEKGNDFIQLTFLKAQAQYALSQAVDFANQALEKQNSSFNFGDALKAQFSSLTNFLQGGLGNINIADAAAIGQQRNAREAEALRKRAELYKTFFTNLQQQAGKFAKEKGLDIFGGDDTGNNSIVTQQLKLQQAQLKIIQDSQKFISQDESKSYDERYKALKRWSDVSLELIEVDGKLKKQTENLTSIEISTIDKETYNNRMNSLREYNAEALKMDNEREKELSDLQKSYNEQIKEYQKQAYAERIGEFEDYGNSALEATADFAQKELIELEKAYAKGYIGKSEYEQSKLDIEYQANRQSLEIQLSTISQIIALNESMGKDVTDEKKKLSDLTRKLAKADADYEIAQIKSVAEARKAQNAAIKELVTETFKVGVSLVNASYENEKNRIQEQSDAIDVKRDKDIKEVDRQLLSEQEKADKIAVINAKAQAQKDLLDQRRRQVAERQARFDKAVSLANIVQNTYAGAARALKDYPFPFSSIIAGLVIATGLAQAAQVIATPIPKYAKGTDYHKGGPMIVGDAGEELVIEPNGRKYITPDTDTLTMAPKGTKVIPNHELVKMMATPDRVQYVGGQAVDISKLVQAQNKTTAAIQKQQMAATLITKQGWSNRQMKVTNWNAYKQNRLN